MKLLIAADGSAVTGRVARRFERALWYVIVDDEKGILDAVRNDTPLDHTRILGRAEQDGVHIVVTDKIRRKAVRHLLEHHLRAANGRGLTTREVMEKSLRGGLHVMTEEELHLEVEGPVRPVSMVPPARRNNAPRTRASASERTPRGQHHLQQYAGRGH